jgi:hypothetical protein
MAIRVISVPIVASQIRAAHPVLVPAEGLPYLVVDCIEPAAPQTVVILRVLHRAMLLWPPVKE